MLRQAEPVLQHLTTRPTPGVQGLSEGDGPFTIAYTYDGVNELTPEGEEPVPIAGETEPPEEPSAPEQKVNFLKEHEVAPVGHLAHDALLLDLITKPVKFTVTGNMGEGGEFKGTFDVDIKELLWRQPQDPDEDDDKIKDYPFVCGDFDVKKVGAEGEEGTPPVLEDSSLKVSVCIELSDFAMTVEEGEQSNVVTITIQEMHNLPKAWDLEEGDEGGEDHAFAYEASYGIPSSRGITEVKATPGTMVPMAAPKAAEEQEEGKEEGEDGGEKQEPKPKTPDPEPDIAVLQHTLREVDVNNEKSAQRVVWGHTTTVFMNQEVISNFANELRRGTKFAVDLRRLYKDETKDYPYATKYHGKSEMNLSQARAHASLRTCTKAPMHHVQCRGVPLSFMHRLRHEVLQRPLDGRHRRFMIIESRFRLHLTKSRSATP